MQTQRQELLTQLTVNGWQIASEEDQLEWWADEMWRIESVWSPVGSCAYVTFLVDPQFDGQRKRGEKVWAVAASKNKPESRMDAEGDFTISLGSGWKKQLDFFFCYLAALRNHEKTH